MATVEEKKFKEKIIRYLDSVLDDMFLHRATCIDRNVKGKECRLCVECDGKERVIEQLIINYFWNRHHPDKMKARIETVCVA